MLFLFGQPIAVDPDDHRLARVDLRRARRGGFLDAVLGQPFGDRLGHPAMRLDFLDQRPGFLLQFAGQFLDIPAAAERVGDRGHPAFFRENQLRVAGDARGEIGRQRDRFVEAVGVQRLRAAEHRRQRLDRGADDVVVRVLLGQADAARLAMRAQPLGLRPSCAPRSVMIRCHSVRAARSLATSMNRFMPMPQKKLRRPAKSSMSSPSALRRADIFHAVGERVGELLHRRRPGLVHVIAADRDRVELGHLRRAISDDVADDPHRGFGRVDVGVADRELFQDVVLDGAGELVVRNALLLAGDDEEGHDRKHRAVHGHADRHLDRAGCRRTAISCPRRCRSRRRPCRRRRRRADCRCRSRGAWRDRRRR